MFRCDLYVSVFHIHVYVYVLGLIVYVSVFATDAAGLTSLPAVSDGIMLDLTPPQPESSFSYSHNIIQNPSFEQHDNQAGLTIEHWDTEGKVEIDSKGTAKDGVYYVRLVDGEITQDVVTTPGIMYRLQLYAAQGEDSTDTEYKITPCSVSIANLQTAFAIYTQPASTGNNDFLAEWSHSTFYFQASRTTETLIFSSMSKKGSVLLDAISVQAVIINEDNGAGQSAVDMKVTTTGQYSTVTASWHLTDPESPIIQYMWAIGTVRG